MKENNELYDFIVAIFWTTLFVVALRHINIFDHKLPEFIIGFWACILFTYIKDEN